jgi:hypothetical protein
MIEFDKCSFDEYGATVCEVVRVWSRRVRRSGISNGAVIDRINKMDLRKSSQ